MSTDKYKLLQVGELCKQQSSIGENKKMDIGT